LGVEVIDLLCHRVDPDVPIEDMAGALKELIAKGSPPFRLVGTGRSRTS
jgi:aryl-alcohol dehydrogenase-like predicted oxidoreductase